MIRRKVKICILVKSPQRKYLKFFYTGSMRSCRTTCWGYQIHEPSPLSIGYKYWIFFWPYFNKKKTHLAVLTIVKYSRYFYKYKYGQNLILSGYMRISEFVKTGDKSLIKRVNSKGPRWFSWVTPAISRNCQSFSFLNMSKH